MVEVRQHIPNFCSGADPQTMRVESWQEVRRLDWVDLWSKDPGFHRYSVDRHCYPRPLLMAEFNGGREWYVLAYLSEDLRELPAWKPMR
jgi:hypothetical protein